MKIAILTPTFCHFSGIDRVVELEAEEYIKQGHDVAIQCLYSTIKPKHSRLIELGMPKSPTFERIYRLLFFLNIPRIWKAASLIREYDVAVSQLYPMNLIARYAKKKYGLRYVCRYHGFTPYNMFNSPIERAYMLILNRLIFWSMKNADEIYSDSKFVEASLIKAAGLRSIVKYIPINRKMYNKSAPIAGIIRKEAKALGGPFFLYVGRISPHKGLHLLMQAFSQVLLKAPNARLFIIGKPTFRKYYNLLTNSASKGIIFKGFVDDKYLPSYYRLCTAYVTCSMWEGYDMPAVEAQACGKPVVAFKVGAHEEVVKNGKLVKPGDVNGFSEAMLQYI